MVPFVLVLIVAGAVAYAATPGVLALSKKIGAVDIPDDRKVHAVPTPTLGGAAILAGVLAALAAAAGMKQFRTLFGSFFAWPLSEAAGIVAGAIIIFTLGVIDDLKGMRAPVKLSGQLLAAGVVFLSGVRLQYFRFPVGGVGALSMGTDLSAIATILWIVVVVNAVNLMDGLDGLAAGITAIAAGAFFVYSYQLSLQGLAAPEPTAQLISIILVGACIGFLRYNFNPARIFMGDSGAMTIGFLLATATVAGVGRTAVSGDDQAASVLFYLPLVIPLIVLAIPILDTVLAIVRRARRGQHVFHADRQHLHHRLLEIGHGHRQAVLIMYAWASVTAGVTLSLSFDVGRTYTFLFIAAAVGILLYTVLPRWASQQD
ncbi:MAG: MraY family glycosyltransferase [Actinomycetota bacterium]